MLKLLNLLLASFLIVSCSDNKSALVPAADESLSTFNLLGLTVRLPSKPIPDTIDFDADTQDVLSDYEMLKTKDNKKHIAISRYIYSSSVDLNPIENLTELAGDMENELGEFGAKDFVSNIQDYQIGGLSGGLAKIEYMHGGHSVTISVIEFTKGQAYWKVMIVCTDVEDSKSFEEYCLNIYHSITIH
jgi:hypothetical protein